MKIKTLLIPFTYQNLRFKNIVGSKGLLMFLFFACVIFLTPTNVLAQDTSIKIDANEITVGNLLSEIEKQTDFLIVYRNKEVDTNRKVKVSNKSAKVPAYLEDAFKNTDIKYEFENNYIVLSQKEAPVTPVQAPQQQKVTITGTINDAGNLPLIGVSVQEKNNMANGVLSDDNGQYTITVSPDATLVFSYMGFTNKEENIGNRSQINVELKEDSELLGEAVVVGYGTMKRENLTGSVTQIKMEEVLGDRPIISASSALQGNIPGLYVSGNHQPGQSKDLQIRDAYSLGSNSVMRPLVLIDNVQGNMDMVNPNDIASITVLKDAASAAIYGARAAGGVIIITTHQPRNNTKFTLNYNNNFGFESAINLPKQIDLDTYFRMYQEAGLGANYWAGGQNVEDWRRYLKEYKANPSAFNIVGDGLYDDGNAIYYLNEHDTYKQFMESSFMMSHNISASGGTEKIRYRLSGGYTSQDGPLITDADKFKRLNIGAFISADVTPWFTQVVDVRYARSDKSMPGNSTGNLYNTRLLSYYPEGTVGAAYGFDEEYPVNTPRNNILYGNNNNTINNNPRILAKSIFKPIEDFEAVFEYTFDKRDTQYDYYSGKYLYTDIQQGLKSNVEKDSYRKQHYYTNYNAINLYGTYTKSFGKHNFKLMAGFNQEMSYYENVDVTVYNQASLGVPSLGGTTDKTLADLKDEYSEFNVRGGFFRFNYNFQNKYLLEVNGRYDGSSKFPKNHRYGFFPSVSVGWQVGRESFMEFSKNWLDEFKIRASWGKIGNQNISPYLFTPSMSLTTSNVWLDSDSKVNIIGTPALVRQNFTWENVATTNIGVDFSFLRSRLRGTFEWYQRNTTGQLGDGLQLPSVVGATAPKQNVVDTRTRGWEFSINWSDKIGEVGYHVGFNIFDARTMVTKYKNEGGLFYKRNRDQDAKRYREGMYIDEVWGYVTDGYYTVSDFEDTQSWKLVQGVPNVDGYTSRLRPGDIKYKNLSDGDGTENVINEGTLTTNNPGDLKIIGNEKPRYQFGANLGVNYAGFDLNVFLQGVGKRDYWLSKAAIFPFNGAGPGDAMFCPVYYNQTDYWTPIDPANGNYNPVNPNAELPRIYDYSTANSVGSNTHISDKYMQKAAYLRIKNISLSYTLPKKWLEPTLISQLKVFANIENLHTFTSLPKGYDPETVSWSYPCYRTISFGVNVTF